MRIIRKIAWFTWNSIRYWKLTSCRHRWVQLRFNRPGFRDGYDWECAWCGANR